MAAHATHPCPASGCGKPVEHDKLMCLSHWRRVPKDIQREVWSTWRRVHRDPQAYREARDKAIDAVNSADFNSKQGSLL